MGDSLEKVRETKQHLIEGTTRYMRLGGAEDENDPEYDPNWDCGYSLEHIDHCSELLDNYIVAVSNARNDRVTIMQCVKFTVLELNKLNEYTKHRLIETDQREDICSVIIRTADLCGLGCGGKDITEEWREW